MKTRLHFTRSSLALLAALAPLACNAHVLDIGSTDGGSNGNGNGSASSNGAGASPGAMTYSGGCTASSCANAPINCSGLASSAGPATPQDEQCVPSPYAGQGSEPAGSCIVKYVCSVPSVGAAPDGGACPAWTTPMTATPCPAGESCAGASASAGGLGQGAVSVEIDPSTGASAAKVTLSAYLTYEVSTGLTQAFGACSYDPKGASHPAGGIITGSPSPNAGPITAKAASLAVAVNPACDGTYADVSTSQTVTAGDLVSFAWSPPPSPSAGSFGALPTSLPQVPAPHLIALAAGQALASTSPSIPRASDLQVAWTTSGAPMSLEQVVVRLTQGTATVTCSFPATDGSGVVPADALLKLSGAPASYEVFSQHASSLGGSSGGSGWSLSFSVNAIASGSGGLAKGTATLQ